MAQADGDADHARYRAFLSYSSLDGVWAERLHRSLEAYLVPRRMVGRETIMGRAPRRLRPIFRDRAELAADPDLAGRIAAALEDSASLIVICSPAAAASRWVNEEIRRFRALRGPERILCVIVAGEPRGGAVHEYFPPALREAAGAEPIAADLRPGGDGRRLAQLKLVAGMLGVGLDELVRREDQRRHRRLLAITAGALAGMTVMTVLAISAVLARNEAQVRRAKAEDLVEYMLTDLSKKLQPTGRLDLMDAVGRKALAYYANEPARGLDAAALGRRSRALNLVGQVSSLRGNLDEALKSYGAASATTAEALRRAPGNGDRVFEHAQSVFWVGQIAWQRGDAVRAERAFQTYRELAVRLVAIDPGRDDWRAEVAFAEGALGALLLEQGKAQEAAEAFARSLAVKQALADRAPADVPRRLSLGQAYAWSADAEERLGRLAEARLDRTSELALYEQILAADPADANAGFSKVVAERALARLDLAQGRRDAALARCGAAAREAEHLLSLQPDNMDHAGAAAIAELDLADTLLAAGRAAAAQREETRAAHLVDEALGHDDKVKLWREYRVRASLVAGAIDLRRRDIQAALAADTSAFAEARAVGSPGLNTDARWLLERARLQLGDALWAKGDSRSARSDWSAASSDLSGRLDEDEPRLLAVLEAVDQRLGDRDAARAIARRLIRRRAPPEEFQEGR